MIDRLITGRIFDIQRFSIHDGPGIRTTVFLKGCPLHCAWCHNPEGRDPQPLLSFNPDKCIACRYCVHVCPNKAHVIGPEGHELDRDRCEVCGLCTKECYSGALELVGREMTVEEVMADVLRDKRFYESSSGGMTLSGGEPMSQIDFTEALLAAAKGEGLHCAVDTCGFCDFRDFERILEYVDLFLYDIKSFDDELHRSLTGESNAPVLRNIEALCDRGARVLVRLPIIPSFNDGEDHFRQVAALLKRLPFTEGVEVLPYHRAGIGKAEQLGLDPASGLKDVPPEESTVESWLTHLRALGVHVINRSNGGPQQGANQTGQRPAQHEEENGNGLAALREEMKSYYRTLRTEDPEAPYLRQTQAIWTEMDRFADQRPDCNADTLKARLHDLIAERVEPVIFPHSPFYFEMGLRHAVNWGVGCGRSAGDWLKSRRKVSHVDPDADEHLKYFYTQGIAYPAMFDEDHRSLGYTRLLREGVTGIIHRIEQRKACTTDEDEVCFLDAAERSCRAVIRIAERFRDKARQMLASEKDPQARRFLGMIAATAHRVPAQPPRSFYEGLAALWFLREVSATLEAVGMSAIGHLDKHLIGLYRSDVENGRLDEQEARDLLARWMLPTDIRFNVREGQWPETSTCMQLGGCDEDGNPVFNELTRMILELHQELGILNPKPNCRFSADAPREYLDLLSRQVLQGHNVIALHNDDVLIPALVKHGKSERDARRYVNGGCQETITEGVEHSAGAFYYFNMPRVLDICLLGALQGAAADPCPGQAAASIPQVVEDIPDFEVFYERIISALEMTMSAGARWRKVGASRWGEINPCPFYSSSIDGCIENARDYTAGVAKYNDSTICLVGLATMVDSLHAVRVAVFDEGWCTLPELKQALGRNWESAAALRARMIALPKFGHGHAAVDSLAARLSADLAALARSLENERGAHFQSNLFVYYAFTAMGQATRATPDGRRDGDLLSQGASPGRINPPRSPTDIASSLSHVDFQDHPGNAVLDLQLPIGGGIEPDALSAAVRTFGQMGTPTLQFNCVSIDDLKDAQVHPERHQDLQVRICGLSAYFVALDRATQDEIIGRSLVGA